MKKILASLAFVLMTFTANAQTYHFDVNKDGEINLTDALLVIDYILGRFTSEDENPPQSYLACPDDHHPHWIDLGLPSGTLWSCCNEGASKPEDYGGYYYFGQVSKVPSYDQINELFNNCPSEWTTLNGVNVRQLTSEKNGGVIFLPAAGSIKQGKLFDAGTSGHYWSSTLRYDSSYAYFLDFSSDYMCWNFGWSINDIHDVRLSVRPVR